MKLFFILAALSLFGMPLPSKAQLQLKEGLNQSTIRVTTSNQEHYAVNALIWLPEGYNSNQKYPLVIYGHGASQAGQDITKLYEDGLPKVLKEGFKPPFPCIIICPQRDSYGALPEWLPGILQDAGKRWSIDTTRIYLTGTSAGGFLCFGSQLNISPELGKKFAAICVLSGATQDANQNNIGWWIKNGTPLWTIIGSDDQSFVRQNVTLTRALNQQLPGIARISIRPGIGHGGWTDIYDGNFRDNAQNIWDWLYQFRTGPGQKTSRITRANRRINLKARDGQVYCNNVTLEYEPQPGDTLVVPRNIQSFLLRNFKGSKERPILLIPEDSSWIGGYGPYSAVVSNAEYFKITGFHIDGHSQSNLGMAIASQTTNYEISHCSIRNTAAIGLCAKQDPDSSWPGGSWPGFSIRNVAIHDITVRNTGTEGLYIGYTFDVIKPLAAPLVNLHVYNISIDSAGWDGLQLSNCQQVDLHNVIIKNYGLKNQKGQQAGLLLGGMVTLGKDAHDIRVSNGTGAGLLIFGRGAMTFNKVRLTKVGQSIGENAIFVNDYADLGYHLPPLALNLINISVTGSSGSALEVINGNGTMKPGRIENFSFSGTQNGIHTPSSSLFTIK